MSSKLTPVDWKTLAKIFELEGFKQERTSGSHLAMVKQGVKRPVVIPMYPEVTVSIIKSNMRTAGMSRQRYLTLLKKAK